MNKSMEELLQLLSTLRLDVDFVNQTRLIDDHVLDSFDIISLVRELSDHYDIEIGVEHLLPENFNSSGAMLNLITKLQDQD